MPEPKGRRFVNGLDDVPPGALIQAVANSVESDGPTVIREPDALIDSLSDLIEEGGPSLYVLTGTDERPQVVLLSRGGDGGFEVTLIPGIHAIDLKWPDDEAGEEGESDG